VYTQEKRIKMYIKHIILAGITVWLYGCIGENSDDKKETSTTPTASTTTTSSNKAAAPGTPGVEPAIYTIRTTPSAILQTYFQEYAAKNSDLEKRAEYATTNKIDGVLTKLIKWSDGTWKDQHSSTMETPPDVSNIHIIYDQGGSVLAADKDHLVHNLVLDKETGLYLPAKTSVLATKIDIAQKSWIDVKGRLGSAELDMDSKSVIDLTSGYGLVLEAALADIAYDEKTADTGILELRESGELRNDGGYFLLHKADVKGNMGVNDATFNFQTRLDHKTENIGFFHTGGKIHPLAEEGIVPDIMMTVRGPFQFKSGAKIEMFFNHEKVSRIVLQYPFSIALGTGEPIIEGAFSFVPKAESLVDTTGDGILVMESNTQFPATLSTSISQLVEGDIVLGKKLSLAVSSDRQKIHLKITPAPENAKLKASIPMQHAMETFRQGTLRSELWNHPIELTRNTFSNTQLIINHSKNTSSDISTHAALFGLKHVLNFEVGDLAFTQIFSNTTIHDDMYRFLPQSYQPFWIAHHKIAFEKGFAFGTIKITPSVGVNHFMIPTTLFQKSFQTILPELKLRSSINYTAESNLLSLNMIIQETYHDGWGKRNDEDWTLNAGMNVSLQTPIFNISTGILNPISSTAEAYVSFSYCQ